MVFTQTKAQKFAQNGAFCAKFKSHLCSYVQTPHTNTKELPAEKSRVCLLSPDHTATFSGLSLPSPGKEVCLSSVLPQQAATVRALSRSLTLPHSLGCKTISIRAEQFEQYKPAQCLLEFVTCPKLTKQYFYPVNFNSTIPISIIQKLKQ